MLYLADNGFSKQSKNILFGERIKENSSCTIQRVFSFISKQQKPLIFHERHSGDPEIFG
jgi:hypothetical protein